ncbi:MAG: protoglobin domain-containing protein [Verrucomicrobiales bacterium]|nr:protoglobin domain-containing protein [Verrucomicrobiales bacterium]
MSRYENYTEMKKFVGFTSDDIENLKSMAPVFEKHGATLTDFFYETLELYPETAALIEGRVDTLKLTHSRWMGELFTGVEGGYDEAYFNNRDIVGKVHVKIGLDPRWVEGVMNIIRTGGHAALSQELESAADLGAKFNSLCKILDLDLMVINLSYADERLTRLATFTGMSRKLIENCINSG